MKLYWEPGTCAIGIHILLEEVGKALRDRADRCFGGATRTPAFLAVNPKGKVSTLVRDDGSVLTEFSAIATWLARTSPDKGLMPDDPDAEARVVETMAYVEGTIHGLGYGHIFAPQLFEPQDAVHGSLGLGHEKVRRQGREIVAKGFAILDPQLWSHSYAAGETITITITIADVALFYLERWALLRREADIDVEL